MKINKSELFKKAWKTAKQAAEKFSGPAKSFFAAALKQAWKELKKRTEKIDIEKLKKLGREWKAGDHHRIYFNQIAGWLGLKIEKVKGVFYFNGVLQEDGRIAKKYDMRLFNAKIFYDLKKEEFFADGLRKEEIELALKNIQKAIV